MERSLEDANHRRRGYTSWSVYSHPPRQPAGRGRVRQPMCCQRTDEKGLGSL